MQPFTPTATAKQIQRDGRLLIKLMKAVAIVRLPHDIPRGQRPLIIAGNHQSLLDVFLSAAVCANAGKSCRFLVNAKYFKGLIGRWLRRIGCIPLDSNTKGDAFVEARAALARGEVVGIMPEGRLSKPEERDPQTALFRPGVAMLAAQAGADVRPITFHQSGLAWPRDKWPRIRVRRPIVTLQIGEIVGFSGDDPIVNAERVRQAVTEMLNQLDAVVHAELGEPAPMR